MTNEEMKAELDRANGLLVEKIGRQPVILLDLKLTDSGRWRVGGAFLDTEMREHMNGALCDTPEEAFASIFSILAEMPDPDTAAKRKWQKSLGKVIDEGHALNLPNEVMEPLRAGSQAMTENLLAAPVKKEDVQ